MAFPLEVPIDAKTLERLTKTYKIAYAQIVAELEGATDFGIRNRRAILAQIENILGEFGQDVSQTVDAEIRRYYKLGADAAVDQLHTVDAPVPLSGGFNRIHKDAIAALVDDTQKAFAESVRGVARSARLILGKATRERITQQMATGKIGGAALREVKRTVIGAIREQGIDSIVDRAGRSWTLDRYAEMLIRTKSVEARNRGLVNRMAENDYDLVQVSAHAGCEKCAPWEGAILSVSGKTPGYPTVADAEADGLFHPNCRHAINVLVPELAAQTHAYNPNIDTVTGADFVDEVDEKFKGAYRPPNQVIGTKTPAR